MIPFEIAEPRTLREAVSLLDLDDPNIRPLGGGTALEVAGDSSGGAGGFSVSLAELRSDWSATLPAVLGPIFAPSAFR